MQSISRSSMPDWSVPAVSADDVAHHLAQITSPLHLQTAAVQALFAESTKTLQTKSLHSEIIWYLDPTSSVCPYASPRDTPVMFQLDFGGDQAVWYL